MPDLWPLRRLAVLGLLIVGLAGCGGVTRGPAPDPVSPAARAAHDGPASVTLLTVKNVQSGGGDHAALLIKGSERVLYDPAGSFELPVVPRRHDVLYAITPEVEQIYLGYHARATHYVVARSLSLDRAAADRLIALAEAEPPARPGFCAIRAGAVLRNLDGMQDLSGSPWPSTLGRSFGAKPGVTNRRITATDVPLWARTRGPGFVADPGPADGDPAGAPLPTAAPAG